MDIILFTYLSLSYISYFILLLFIIFAKKREDSF